ncbi:hypothetical protein [Nioella sp. MMSF_3534]|uniref:hypothetical protein n=1 Tax=Nioella sp. MMSF_3534 TaxID=3046720 RepID=UPI00273EA268|nr:hypothetical protein [Nioella sp. MMSF_3534]
MTIIHTGFDGIDLALKTTVPIELVEFLEEGKATAQELMTDVWGSFAGLDIQSGQSGKRGGNAFTFRVYEFGATWFAKKPRASDPWGLYVSIGSRELALNGLDRTRQKLNALLVQLGFQLPHDGVSINRVDFAVDILSPGFVLDPDAFVFHSRANRKAIAEFETVEMNGHSGRTTSVTIGKMPGRQVIVYDKREEVMKRRKHEWPLIWNANLQAAGLGPLDLSDRATSQVWRIELRLGKDALRNRKDIRGWGSLHEHLQAEMDQLAQDVTLTVPSSDSNRSRWLLHPLWPTTQEAVANRLFEHVGTVPPEAVREIDLREKQLDLLKLIVANSVTLAYLEGLEPDGFEDFTESLPNMILGYIDQHPRGIDERFQGAAAKYCGTVAR